MAIDLSGEAIICPRCGTRYPKRTGNFYVNHGSAYRGIGYVSVCKPCVSAIYTTYLHQRGIGEDAVRQTCRKLDLVWDKDLYDSVAAKSVPKSFIDVYVLALNKQKYHGRSYDDTLIAENSMWSFGAIKEEPQEAVSVEPEPVEPEPVIVEESEEPIDVDPELLEFWGDGYDAEAYTSLQKRYDEWRGDSTFDTATEMLVKQICLTEQDIAKDRADGRSPEKSITILNTLLGSANLKPAQQQKTDEAMALADVPLGVWLYRYESERPLPEVDDELKDVNHIRKYVFTWMGHLCKMLNIKNSYSDLYDETMAEYTVQKPEYDEEEYDDALAQSQDEEPSYE